MTLNLDNSFFSVICDLGNCLYMPETDLADMKLARIVEDVKSGQLENVQAVLEYNPFEGWCSNITEAVMTAALSKDGQRQEMDRSEDWSDYSSERVDGRLAGVGLHFAA